MRCGTLGARPGVSLAAALTGPAVMLTCRVRQPGRCGAPALAVGAREHDRGRRTAHRREPGPRFGGDLPAWAEPVRQFRRAGRRYRRLRYPSRRPRTRPGPANFRRHAARGDWTDPTQVIGP